MKKERSENEEEKVFSTLFGNKDSKTQEAKSLLISKIFYPFLGICDWSINVSPW